VSWLLDTCVLSELVKPKPDAGLIAWIESSDEARLYISALTLGELAKGIARLPTGAKRNRVQAWLDRDLAERFSGRVLPIDQAVALRWGRLQAQAEKHGRPMPVVDGLIASTAVLHDLAIVTRNGDDMAQSGAVILDPWKE
jgi:predicted nucleic acid-binding protein